MIRMNTGYANDANMRIMIRIMQKMKSGAE